jgi:hypothetical protein
MHDEMFAQGNLKQILNDIGISGNNSLALNILKNMSSYNELMTLKDIVDISEEGMKDDIILTNLIWLEQLGLIRLQGEKTWGVSEFIAKLLS